MRQNDWPTIDDQELREALTDAPRLAPTAALVIRVADHLDADVLPPADLGRRRPVAPAPDSRMRVGEMPRRAARGPRMMFASKRGAAATIGVLVAAIAAPTAYAFRDAIRNLFEGSPAPAPISTQFANADALHTAQAALARQEGRPNVARWNINVAEAHGIISLATSDGTVDVWGAPEGGGGKCWIVEIPTPSQDPPFRSAGSCDSSATHASSAAYPSFAGPLLVWPLRFDQMPHVWLVLVRVYSAVSVDLKLPSGETTPLPVTENFALAQIPSSVQTGTILARNGAGNIIGSSVVDQAHLVSVG